MSSTKRFAEGRETDIRAVHRVLQRKYGDFTHFNKSDTLDNLIFVICSVRATESVYRRVYDKVRSAYPRAAAIGGAPIAAIAAELKDAGRQRQKAKAIKAAVRLAIKTFGKASLEGLRQYSDSECEKFLRRIPWVGLKVARCVMMIPLDRPVFPVDTHVWRISRRLRWVRSGKNKRVFCTNSEMNRLQDIIPAELRKSLHVNMISLGREYCLATRPKCFSCPLAQLCPTAKSAARKLSR